MCLDVHFVGVFAGVCWLYQKSMCIRCTLLMRADNKFPFILLLPPYFIIFVLFKILFTLGMKFEHVVRPESHKFSIRTFPFGQNCCCLFTLLFIFSLLLVALRSSLISCHGFSRLKVSVFHFKFIKCDSTEMIKQTHSLYILLLLAVANANYIDDWPNACMRPMSQCKSRICIFRFICAVFSFSRPTKA